MIKPGDSVDIERLNKKLLRKNYIIKGVDDAFYYMGDDKFPEGYYDFISRTYMGNDKTLDEDFSKLTESDVRSVLGESELAKKILNIINNENPDLDEYEQSINEFVEIINKGKIPGLI